MALVSTRPAANAVFAPLGDADALVDGPILVSAARFLKEADALLAHPAPVGVAWPNAEDVSALAPYVGRLALVTLFFPKFRDGRAFSQARLLRERFGFEGELRATGNVLQDQILLMARSGFDTFEVEKEADLAAFEGALKRYTLVYQPTGDGRRTVREARAAAEVRP